MKFSTIAISTFLASLANSQPIPDTDGTVIVYHNPSAAIHVRDVYVTVTVGAGPEPTPGSDNEYVVERTAYVDEDGDIITIQSDEESSTTTIDNNDAPASTISHSHQTDSPVVSPTSVVTTSSPSSAFISTTLQVTSSSLPPATSSAAPTPTSSAAPSNTASSDNSNLGSFAQSILDSTNKYRALHKVGPVTWSDTLTSYAQNYLNNQNCVFAHSGGPYGENLAMGFADPSAAVDAWYNEVKDYNYDKPDFSMSTGHFTQLVWKDTTQIGCAAYDCPNGKFIACEYNPPGNVIGLFANNVF